VHALTRPFPALSKSKPVKCKKTKLQIQKKKKKKKKQQQTGQCTTSPALIKASKWHKNKTESLSSHIHRFIKEKFKSIREREREAESIPESRVQLSKRDEMPPCVACRGVVRSSPSSCVAEAGCCSSFRLQFFVPWTGG
jgi:hypothetical protein